MTLDANEEQGQSLFRSPKTTFASTARVLRLVWACSPALTLLTTLITLTQSLTPAASAYAGKLVVDSVVQAIGDPTLGLNGVLPARRPGPGPGRAGYAAGSRRTTGPGIGAGRGASQCGVPGHPLSGPQDIG